MLIAGNITQAALPACSSHQDQRGPARSDPGRSSSPSPQSHSGQPDAVVKPHKPGTKARALPHNAPHSNWYHKNCLLGNKLTWAPFPPIAKEVALCPLWIQQTGGPNRLSEFIYLRHFYAAFLCTVEPIKAAYIKIPIQTIKHHILIKQYKTTSRGMQLTLS